MGYWKTLQNALVSPQGFIGLVWFVLDRAFWFVGKVGDMDTIIAHAPKYAQLLEWIRALSPFLGLALIAYAVYRAVNPKGKLVEVSGKNFRNEPVVIDGKRFIRCTFRDVTFVHNGGDYALKENALFGVRNIKSENPEIIKHTQLLYAMDYLKIPLVDEHDRPLPKGMEVVKPPPSQPVKNDE